MGLIEPNDDKTDLVWDGDQIIQKVESGSATSREFAWGALQDQLVEIQEIGTSVSGLPERHIPLTDHRNAVVGLWEAADQTLETIADYTTHGRLTVRDSQEDVTCSEPGADDVCSLSASPFAFGTMLRSRRTGLSYMRNRWYSPRLRQFLSPDPAGYVDSYNPYAYVAFDPINGWDPYGLKTFHFTDTSPFGLVSLVYWFGNDDGVVEQAADVVADVGKAAVEEIREEQEEALKEDSTLAGVKYSMLEVVEVHIPTTRHEVMLEASLLGGGLVLGRVFRAGKAADDALRGADDVARGGDDVAKGADETCTGGTCANPGVPCFEKDTDVRLCDGTSEDIEEIEVGDRVLARNARTNETTCRRVEKTMVTPNARTLLLRLETVGGETQTLRVTGDHPFWTSDAGWTEASDLEAGDRVYSSSGARVRVIGWRWREGRRTVYNLEVAKAHTYFVGEPAVWVHNSCADELIEQGRKVQGKFPGQADADEVLYRVDSETGKVTNYQVYDSNGMPVKRVDLRGRPHAGMDQHVHEFQHNTNPAGETFVNKGKVRPAKADEIPENH